MSEAYKKAEKLIVEAKTKGATELDLGWMSLEKVPDSIRELTGLQSLNLSRNQISDYSFLEKLTGLQSLDLSRNQISDYSFLEKLTGLQSLDLSNNQISDYSFLENLTGLQSLDLSRNQISDYSFLEKLIGLQTLDLSNNQISDINFLEKLTSLQTLDLSGNHISDISFLEKLTDLQTLDLGRNQITDYSFLEKLTGLHTLGLNRNQISDYSFLEKLTSLQTLDLSGNQITDISFRENLTGLQILNLSYNQITDISFLEKLTGLQTLNLSYNQISDYSFLEKLTGLQSLDLSTNQIAEVSFLEKLTSLKSLYLGNTRLTNYRFLECLTGLEELFLHKNELTNVSFLENLTDLKQLALSDNQITDISYLRNLTDLEWLYLPNNQITDITSLAELIKEGLNVHAGPAVEGIVLASNPITTPPLSIVEDGRESVLNWFEQAEKQGLAPLYEAKLMILGQGGAGKTTFASLQVDPLCDVKKKQLESTLGIEVYEGVKFRHQDETLGGQEIFTRLWDFGGQNIQKMLHQFFITEDCLYVLVHDKRKESTDFDYWFQIIELLGPGSSVIVLENQSDSRGNNESFALSKYQGLFRNLQIEREEVNLWKTRGIHKARWARLNGMIEEKLSNLEIVNREVPSKWSKVREFLVEKREEKYIRLNAFLKHCKEQIGLNKEQANLALSYLRALGDVVHFDERDLRDYIFLDHNWLTEGVYYILADESIETGKGKFTEQQAFAKWEEHGYSEEAKSMLLKLMLKNQFDLSYEVSKDTFITPLLLPVDRPKSAKPLVANLHFRFQYGFMPHGLFSRAIVRLHEKIDGEKRWKSGVFLKEGKNRAEIQQYNDPKDNQQVIDIRIEGDQKGCKSMLDFVRTNIEHLHKEFKNLKVYRKVGCNCAVCQDRMKGGDNPSFYDYEQLVSRVENRRYFVDCPNDSYNPVNIGQILNDVITEDAGEKSVDSELLYKLKEIGMSINKITNNNQANPVFNNNPEFRNENRNTNTNTISLEVKVHIGNLLDEISLLKEDIESELTIEGMPEKEVKKLLQDVELAEKALQFVEESEEEPKRPAKSRIKRFFSDLQDEESSLRKGLQKLRKGRDYGVKLAETYNKIAGNFGMPLVPPAALEVIKSI